MAGQVAMPKARRATIERSSIVLQRDESFRD